MNDRFGNARAKRRHTLRQPLRNTPAMQRKIGSSGSFHEWIVTESSGEAAVLLLPFAEAVAETVGSDDEKHLVSLISFAV